MRSAEPVPSAATTIRWPVDAEVAQLGDERRSVADRLGPARGRHGGRRRPVAHWQERPDRRGRRVRAARSIVDVQSRHLAGRAPRPGERPSPRSTSSATISAARSRNRCGSTSRMSAVAADEVEQHLLVLADPRQPRLHAVERLAVGQPLPLLATPGLRWRPAPRPARARRRSAAARGTGRSRCRRRRHRRAGRPPRTSQSRSTSSPHRSMRTGPSAVDGKMSTIEPRTAISPRCSTWYSRR